MKIVKTKGTIYLTYDSELFDKGGNKVTGVTTVQPTQYNGVIKDLSTIEFPSDVVIKEGDTVDIKYTNGIHDLRVINKSGDRIIKVEEVLYGDIGSDVTVYTMNYEISLGSSVEEGVYYTNANEAVIVSDTFYNIDISKAAIKIRYSELSDNISIPFLNLEAKKAVVADFSFNPNFYKTLDMGQLTELTSRKILMLLDYDKFATNYKEYFNVIKNVITVDKGLDKDITLNKDTHSSIGWGLGV